MDEKKKKKPEKKPDVSNFMANSFKMLSEAGFFGTKRQITDKVKKKK